MNDRLFPATPDSGDHGRGARQGRVLAVRRTRAPLLGHFSLPGCGVEGRHSPPGSREPMEEVGIEAEIVAFNRHVEAAMHEGKQIRTHFVIVSFVVRWIRGEPRLSDEINAIEWIDPVATLPSPTTAELGEVLAREGDDR